MTGTLTITYESPSPSWKAGQKVDTKQIVIDVDVRSLDAALQAAIESTDDGRPVLFVTHRKNMASVHAQVQAARTIAKNAGDPNW